MKQRPFTAHIRQRNRREIISTAAEKTEKNDAMF
jgi:hypothetical protein